MVLGNSKFPDNAHLKYRSLKSNNETEFIFDTMAIEPEFGSSEVSKIYLDFDFTQMQEVTLNFSFMESLVEIIIVLPIVFGSVLALHSLLCFVMFYKDFSRHVQQRYYASLEIEEVLKY